MIKFKNKNEAAAFALTASESDMREILRIRDGYKLEYAVQKEKTDQDFNILFSLAAQIQDCNESVAVFRAIGYKH